MKYIEVNPSEADASKVANLTQEYYILLGTGPADSDGSLPLISLNLSNLKKYKSLETRGKTFYLKLYYTCWRSKYTCLLI